MAVNEAPEKIFYAPYGDIREDAPITDNDIEYIRKDAFIEMACEYWYQYNRNIVKKHGAKAVLGCSEFTVNVEDFKKYMEDKLWNGLVLK